MSSVIVRMKFTTATFVRLRDKTANRTYVLVPNGKNAKIMSKISIDEVLEAIQGVVEYEILDTAFSKNVDIFICSMPWSGLNINWKNIRHKEISLTLEGEYSQNSISNKEFKEFKVFDSPMIVLTFSSEQPSILMQGEDFIRNWFEICSNLFFIPKIILMPHCEVMEAGFDKSIVELEPMEFFRGHLARRYD